MQFKRLISACLISITLISNTQVVLASSSNNIIEIQLENEIKSIGDINTQLTDLYTQVGNELGIDRLKVKQLHLLAGGQCVYADKQANILAEETIKNMKAPMDIDGAYTEYKQAPFITCEDDKIERPSKYYMPDALYSVAYDITALMGQRYNCNRGGMQIYFDSLKEEIKQNIVFYEAVLLYTGESKNNVNNFYTAYEKMLYDKQSHENVVEVLEDGNLKIKSEFLDILNDFGISNETSIEKLATMLSFDETLAVCDDVEAIKDKFIIPYKLNYTSRENMMIAAICLTGKVRYVWGGGHSGSSFIDGINPVWARWENLYPTEKYTEVTQEDGTVIQVANEGYDTCIKPSGTWCPIHGRSTAAFHGGVVYNLDEYVESSADALGCEELLEDKYREMLSKVDYSNGINIHTLDGLDCSGFTSWLYNQITDKYILNSVALNFPRQRGMQEIEFGSEMLPGDTFGWKSHIVAIVGKVAEGSKAYVTIEQTPNVLKFGVVYYTGASQSDIDYAKQIAREANKLIGGLDEVDEAPHVYCMNAVGEPDTTTITEYRTEYRTETVWFPMYTVDPDYDPYEHVPDEQWDYTEQVFIDNGYMLTYYIPVNTEAITAEIEINNTGHNDVSIARFADQYIDEYTPVGELNIPIKDMCALDIIRYTITKLPLSYVEGYNLYEGELFDKFSVGSNLGIAFE